MSHNTRDVDLGKPEVRSVFARRDVERFWAKVNRQGPTPAQNPSLGQCWLWTGGVTGSLSYGQIGVMAPSPEKRQLNYYAHRVAWELSHGAIPAGQQIRHKCDNPRCVNVAHLELGTHKQNMEDAQVRGRLHVQRPTAQRVTGAQIGEMRAFLSVGRKRSDIARQFGVSKAYVTLLAQGKLRQYDAPAVEEKAS